MSSELKNLSEFNLSSLGDASHLHVGVVTADWNADITNALREGCIQTLLAAGIPEGQIHELRVPGTFELPLGAKILENKFKVDGVICLGCVIKGETSHNEYINQSVAQALVQLSIMRHKPFVFGVLTPNNEEQARERAGGKYGNKGAEAAYTGLYMCLLQKGQTDKDSTIGFKKS